MTFTLPANVVVQSNAEMYLNGQLMTSTVINT